MKVRLPMELNIVAPPAPTASGDGVRLTDYVNKVVILQPTAEDVLDTAQGESPITKCAGWAWEDGELVDLGDILVFWTRVRSQLAPLVGTGQATIGKIVRNGRAYELEEVAPEVADKVNLAFGEVF